MKLFLLLIRSSWAAGLTSGVLGAVSGMASLGLITLIHRALTEEQRDSTMLPLLFAGACCMVLVTQVTANWMLVRLSQSTAARLRFELCSKIISSPLLTLESVGPHRLSGTLINDVNAITGALTGFPGTCANAMVLVFGLLYLAKLSLPLALATILMAALGVSTFLTGLHIANRHLKRARSVQDEVMRHLQSMIYGIKELKGNKNRALDFMYDVLLPADSKMRHKLIHGLTIQGFAHSWGRLILFIGIGLLLFLWPRIAPVTTATLTGYTLTILYLTYPLDGILGWLPALNGASIAVSKIEELGLLIEQPDSQPRLTTMPPFHSLELRDVSYQYDTPNDKGFSLGPISFKVSAGEVLFIAGSNGSGKTTLAKLLTGLYVPDSGSMYWNGRSVTNRSRADYRQLFSTVFVEGHLFDRLLGIDVNKDELNRWLTLLGIEDKIDRHSGRFLTDELSRGQHKRLALLVACLDNRPLFVFDEWAAEQDPVFKDVFYRQIVPELSRSGKTVIAITHDDRYFSNGDRMLTLIDGCVVAIDERRAA